MLKDQRTVNIQATARDIEKIVGLLPYRPSPPAEPTPWRYEAQSKKLYSEYKFTIERINAMTAQVLLFGVHVETIRSAKDCPIRLGKLFVDVYASAHDINNFSIEVEL